jgi:hypothetical protein
VGLLRQVGGSASEVRDCSSQRPGCRDFRNFAVFSLVFARFVFASIFFSIHDTILLIKTYLLVTCTLLDPRHPPVDTRHPPVDTRHPPVDTRHRRWLLATPSLKPTLNLMAKSKGKKLCWRQTSPTRRVENRSPGPVPSLAMSRSCD